ncbi:hypothetical protein LTR85_005935 [Meristemomyces frigidus]|nr:hypothetical protein LTR85_005935 [Meristemomyces frigidus]
MHIPVPVANGQGFPTPIATIVEASILSLPSPTEGPPVRTIKPFNFRSPGYTSAKPLIPTKYLLETKSFPADGFYSVTRLSKASTAITMDATIEAEHLLPNDAPTAASAKFRNDLPDMPEWAVGLLGGLLAFGLVITVVLYLANFPPTFTWMHKLLQQRMKTRDGYTQMGGGDDSDGRSRSRTKAGFSAEDSDGCYAISSAIRGSTRRRKSLVVDTSAQYTGLGVALPGDEQTMLRKRRRSYDEEAMRLRRLKPKSSPVRTAWAALTAPVPSVSLFGHNRSETLASGPHTAMPGGYAHMERDMEDGVAAGLDSDASMSDYATSPYKRSAQDPMYGPETNAEMDGLSTRIGSGVEYAAGRLARAFHDQVDSAEDGLLSLVRNHERELALS